MDIKADVGVFGGSGFYSFLNDVKEIAVETPYGPPSDKIALAEIGDKTVAFLPRHGKDHRLPPHMINYRANIYAMKKLGVTRILGPCASGSLQPHVKPGDFVICDQFVNRTWGRRDTFYDGPVTTHIGGAEPYCPELREIAVESTRAKGLPVHEKGTIVVIQDLGFHESRKSRICRQWMGGYQYDPISGSGAGTKWRFAMLTFHLLPTMMLAEDNPEIEPVSHEAVLKVFNENIEHLKVCF